MTSWDKQRTGKSAETYVWMRLMQYNMVPYLPIMDVTGIDVIVETTKGHLAKLQVKSRGTRDPGEQIKNLRRGGNTLAFHFLVIVRPGETPESYEGWVVPRAEVEKRLTPGGDLNLGVDPVPQGWDQYRERWDIIG